MKITAAACFMFLSGVSWAAQVGADPAHERTFRIMLRQADKVDRYDALILKHAQGRRLNPRLVKAIIAAESGFYKAALSPQGARGLMQILPPTAQEMGVGPEQLNDPESNLRAGTAYLNWLYAAAWTAFGLQGVRFRDGPLWAQRRVIAAYHGGPRLLYRSDWPPKTRHYVDEVFTYFGSPVTSLRTRPILLAPEPPQQQPQEILAEL